MYCLSRAKQIRDSFSLSSSKTTNIFELIHYDLWGPYNTTSIYGIVYFLTIVDDYLRSVWIYLLVEKREVKNILNNFFVMAHTQFNEHVKIVRSDNGTKYVCLKNYFEEKGILHQTSIVSTPQQNGRVERKHHHILNVACALLFQASLPIKFWGAYILTILYLINRTPSPTPGDRTLYELLHGTSPSYSHYVLLDV